jgi:hypothetical protein
MKLRTSLISFVFGLSAVVNGANIIGTNQEKMDYAHNNIPQEYLRLNKEIREIVDANWAAGSTEALDRIAEGPEFGNHYRSLLKERQVYLDDPEVIQAISDHDKASLRKGMGEALGFLGLIPTLVGGISLLSKGVRYIGKKYGRQPQNE